MVTACTKCGSEKFSLGQLKHRHEASERLYFVECTHCGSVIDVIDIYGIGDWNDIKRHAYRDVVRELLYDFPAAS